MPGRVRFLDQVPIGFYDTTNDGGGGGNPGGPTGSIQYNYSGSLSGSSNMVWDNPTNTLILNGDINANNINVSQSFTASGLIYPTADNGEESFIQTDGNGNLSLQYVKTVYEEIINGELTQLVKGTPVYVSGSQGAASIVYRADAANPAKMPVIYITADILDPGGAGKGIALGLIKGINTTGYPAGTEIYVAAGGGWTSTRPTGDKIIQVLGYVTKEGNGGQGVILNPGPANLPNIPSGSVWTGNSGSFPTPVLISSLSVATASFALTASFVNTSSTNAFIQNGNSFGAQALIGTNDNQNLAFETSGSIRMFISSSGTTILQPTITGIAQTNALEIRTSVGTTVIQLRNNGTAIFNDLISVPYFSSPNGNILFGGTNVFIGGDYATNPGTRLRIRGSGATSSTTALRVENSNASASLVVLDNGTSQFIGLVGINRTPTSSLDIAGTTRISGSFNTAISGSILTVIGSGSAQPIFTVQGSQGELFSVTDSLTGSLFSVNDISGLPILEVFSDNTTLIGNYQDPMLITTAKVVQTNSGSFTVYSLPTASYDTAFFEYSVKSGSNARAGNIMAIQSGTSVNFTETTTTDFGNTSAISFTVIVSGSNIALTGSSTTGSWTIKTIIRGI
jgi:hypothetical protein